MTATAAPPIEALGVADAVWLAQVTDETFPDSWFRYANNLLQADCESLNGHRTVAPWPRIDFYENQLGMAEPDSPLLPAYGRMVDTLPELEPISDFVGTMRLYSKSKIPIPSLLRRQPELGVCPLDDISPRITDIFKALTKTAGRQLIELDSSVLIQSDYGSRIRQLINVGKRKKWPIDEIRQLPFTYPQPLVMPAPRFTVVARYVRQVSEQALTANRIGDLLMEHPDNYLIALTFGTRIDGADSIQTVVRNYSESERRTIAQRMLRDSRAEQYFGYPTIQAHRDFHASKYS